MPRSARIARVTPELCTDGRTIRMVALRNKEECRDHTS
jgi:hypothetical protein